MSVVAAALTSMPGGDFPSRASNCALMTVCVICICVLVLCGVMIVREYSLASAYEPSTCRITTVKTTDTIQCQFCGHARGKSKEKGAGSCTMSSFPCLKVMASFEVDGTSKEGTLHPDSLQAWGQHSQCSFSVCLKHPKENEIAVNKYAASWESKKGESFPCFYNSVDFKHLILEKKHNKSDVIHSMVWPSLIIILCGIIFLKLEMRRRGLTFWGTTETEKKETTAMCLEEGVAPSKSNKTMVEWHPNGEPCKVECRLIKCQDTGHMGMTQLSSSLSALDKIHKSKQPHGLEAGRLGPSISADGLKHLRVNPGGGSCGGSHCGSESSTNKSLSKYRQDSTKTDSSTGSQGSKIQGLETPV